VSTISFPVPDAYDAEIKNAIWELCPPPPVPEGQEQITKAQNVVRYLKSVIKDHVKEYRRRTAHQTAEAALIQVDTDFQ
jgi:hypothetical protein